MKIKTIGILAIDPDGTDHLEAVAEQLQQAIPDIPDRHTVFTVLKRGPRS